MLSIYLCVIDHPATELDLVAVIEERATAVQEKRIEEVPRLFLGEYRPTTGTRFVCAPPVTAAIEVLCRGPRVVTDELIRDLGQAFAYHNTTELEALADTRAATAWLERYRGRVVFTRQIDT
jgi:hypothetical protein